jgi:hypothetical protein
MKFFGELFESLRIAECAEHSHLSAHEQMKRLPAFADGEVRFPTGYQRLFELRVESLCQIGEMLALEFFPGKP